MSDVKCKTCIHFERMYSRFSGVHSPVELKIEKSPNFV